MRPKTVLSLMGYRLRSTFRIGDQISRLGKQATLLNLSRPARTRLNWILWYETHNRNASAVCRHFGIAPKTFYHWKKRFDPKDLAKLEDRSKSPHRTRVRQITRVEELRVIELRRAHLRWGKMKLQTLYQRIYRDHISSWKIQYTIKRHNLYYNPARTLRLAAKRKRSQEKKRITELSRRPFPGFLVALDGIVRYAQGYKRYVLTAVDTVSKIAFARMYTTKSSRTAADFLKRMVYLLDGAVLNAQHDNGSEFHKEFIASCQALNIQQYWSRSHTPKDNAVNERFNRTLQEEFLALGNFNPDPLVFNQKLTEWLIEYNFIRPHQALGYSTPFELYQKSAKVLPMSSSRTFS